MCPKGFRSGRNNCKMSKVAPTRIYRRSSSTSSTLGGFRVRAARRRVSASLRHILTPQGPGNSKMKHLSNRNGAHQLASSRDIGRPPSSTRIVTLHTKLGGEQATDSVRKAVLSGAGSAQPLSFRSRFRQATLASRALAISRSC